MAEVQTIAVDTVQAQRIGSHNALGLKRNVLTPYGKRWQLWGNGIKGAEADRIIDELYGPVAVQTEAVNRFCEQLKAQNNVAGCGDERDDGWG